MRKFFTLFVFAAMLCALPTWAVKETRSVTFSMETMGFSTSDDLNSLSPISLNEDLQISFSGGNTSTKYATAGYLNIAPNTTILLNGKTTDVMIEELVFTVYRKSYRFIESVFSPTGTLTYDEEAVQNTWTASSPSNAVEIFLGFDNVRPTTIKVKYSGGTAEGDEPDQPDQPDPEQPENDNLLSTGFDTLSEWNQFTVINVQEGTNTWKWSSGNPYGKIENDLGNTIPKDDYLVTPALQLQSGQAYQLTFDTWCGAPDYPEIIAAYLLSSPTDINDKKPIIEPTQVNNNTNNKKQLSGTFNVATSGTYYVAIHAASLPGMHYLYADNITISRGVNALSPGQVTDFIAAPSPLGETTVDISFKAPTICYDGTTPLQSLEKIVIKRNDVQIAEIPATPGQECTYTDNVETAGNYRYAVTAVSSNGKGLDATASVYVGIYRPSHPANLRVEEITPGTVRLTWDPVTTNIYGHTVDSSLVTYRIMEGLYTTYMDQVTDNTVTIDYVSPDDPQKIVTFAVKAVTSAGESNSYAVAETMAVGTPFAMPFSETFSNAELTPGQDAEFVEDPVIPGIWWRCFESTGEVDPVTNDDGLLALISNNANTSSTFRTGKIHIDENAPNPYLSFFYYANPASSSTIAVTVNSDDIETININGAQEGWKEKLVNLSSYKGQDIRIGFTAICNTPQIAIAIDDISVKNEKNNDMAIVRARIPYEMKIGENHQCQIKVTNLGINPSGEYTLSVSADNNEVVSFRGESIERGETAEHNFSLTPDLKPGEDVVYSVTLTSVNDESPEDNTKEVEVAIPDIELPSVTGLHISEKTLTWRGITAQDFPIRQIEESFESYDEFTINTAGEWSFYDGDQYPCRGVENRFLQYPNMYEPMAFMVFNNHDGRFPPSGTASYDPYEGGQSMVSIAADWTNRDMINNDDWMISPELSGAAQTISLYARSRSMVFRETFQILYTKGDDPLNTAAYTRIDQYDEIDPTWTKYTASLPEGATYFAIRNVSLDKYFFFVDNVTFEAAPKPIDVTGYNVYIAKGGADSEWEKVNDALLTSPEYTFDSIGSNDYVKVNAVFANGLESSSEPLNIKTAGADSIDSIETDSTVYYNLNGMRLNGKPLEPGIYIVKDKRGTRKAVIK